MGNIPVTTLTYIRDSQNINMSVYAVKKSGGNELLSSITNGDLSIQESIPSTEFTQSFVGEISGELVINTPKHKRYPLRETQKIIVVAVYPLPTIPFSTTPKYQGFGYVVFRDEDRCTSVQLYLENLTVNQTTATVTYYGYLEKNFDITHCDIVNLEVHTTFFITISYTLS